MENNTIPTIQPKEQLIQQPNLSPQNTMSINKPQNFPNVTNELSLNSIPRHNTPTMHSQPFFIRMDKFNETKDKIDIVNHKITDMEDILEKINKTKEEEEKELSIWKDELKEVKDLLIDIDKEIFNKL